MVGISDKSIYQVDVDVSEKEPGGHSTHQQMRDLHSTVDDKVAIVVGDIGGGVGLVLSSIEAEDREAKYTAPGFVAFAANGAGRT